VSREKHPRRDGRSRVGTNLDDRLPAPTLKKTRKDVRRQRKKAPTDAVHCLPDRSLNSTCFAFPFLPTRRKNQRTSTHTHRKTPGEGEKWTTGWGRWPRRPFPPGNPQTGIERHFSCRMGSLGGNRCAIRRGPSGGGAVAGAGDQRGKKTCFALEGGRRENGRLLLPTHTNLNGR